MNRQQKTKLLIELGKYEQLAVETLLSSNWKEDQQLLTAIYRNTHSIAKLLESATEHKNNGKNNA